MNEYMQLVAVRPIVKRTTSERQEFIRLIVDTFLTRPARRGGLESVEVSGLVTPLKGSSASERYHASFSFVESLIGTQPYVHRWEYNFDHERGREHFDSNEYIHSQLDELGEKVCCFASTFSYELRPSHSGLLLVVHRRPIMH